ncbi:hypothetical protein BMS3Abin15_00713 [bacterium BMS3Abin15]|nr:hypothetical protein BMS3Abin15_00713 [bacterium BMS3Abin15]HDH07413.1 ImmA/IrrE family metallo-endopeptidase [Candidatus Moranbacteria bacterium]HDZ85941.1 ImmA/IrrE family metallo-endopeptidase [Candidatus Moranbacteria bacterium]
MKEYKSINIAAECIAERAYKDTNDELPSILSLIKWTEKNFNTKIRIAFGNLCGSGLVHSDPDTGGYKIWIKNSEPDFRQRFTLCHEIAHVVRNRGLRYGLYTGDIYSSWGEERFCHRFAAAFLMPKELFYYKWNVIRDSNIPFKKARLAKFFNVSGSTVDIRAKELKLI